MSFDAPVVIAGAGPVGTILAMDLARWDIPSIVVERRREVLTNPRCNTTNARSMELLRRLGCADAVRAVGLPENHSTDIVYLTRLNGHELVRFERSTPAEVRSGEQHGVAANWPTPEPQHFVSQIYLEPVLRHHAATRWGVDLRAGWELTSFAQDDHGVTCELRDVDSGQERTLRSRYLVGADGSASMVRRAIDSRLEGIPKLSEMCSTYFRSARVGELATRARGWMLRFLGGGVLVAIDGNDQWLLHLPVPAGQDPTSWDPEPAMFNAIGERFAYEVIERSRWTPRAMVASKWRERSVFLAGDAAHVWVPMGGFGMNAGIADAISLSFRLAGVLQGWACDALLDTYEAERSPIGSAIANQAVTWAIHNVALMADTPERRSELDRSEDARRALGEQLHTAMLSEFECPGFQLGYFYRDSAVICHDALTPAPTLDVEKCIESSWPGVRLPHRWLADGSSIYDRLGLGFSLLRVGDSGRTGNALIDEAAKRGVPLTVVEIEAHEAGDAYDGFELLLVRPDQHVVWRSNSEPSLHDARAVLDRVTAANMRAASAR
jgi:2-polyprenyl-6-methoxyphenol hydroxylase-like FAD-dependent oxidoreductase